MSACILAQQMPALVSPLAAAEQPTPHTLWAHVCSVQQVITQSSEWAVQAARQLAAGRHTVNPSTCM